MIDPLVFFAGGKSEGQGYSNQENNQIGSSYQEHCVWKIAFQNPGDLELIPKSPKVWYVLIQDSSPIKPQRVQCPEKIPAQWW